MEPDIEPDVYDRLLDRVSDGIYFVDLDRHITYWSVGAEHLTGYRAEDVVGQSCSDGLLRHVNAAGHELCKQGCPLKDVMTDGRPREASIFLHHRDGHRVPVTVRGESIRDESGAIVGAAEVFSSQRPSAAAAHERREDDAMPDRVTGLTSRRIGEGRLDALVRRAVTGKGNLGVLFIDVDHFKAVNDTFGHRTGDEVLRMIGRSISSGLRADDVIIRWGGEEFLVLLPGANRHTLQTAAARVRMLVENSWIDKPEGQVRATISIGATMAKATDTNEGIVDRADHLMYASKADGRNRVTTDPHAHLAVPERPVDHPLPSRRPGGVDLA